MKEIKAYIHRNRVAEVISALKESVAWTTVGNEEHNLTAYMVKGSLVPLDEGERRYWADSPAMLRALLPFISTLREVGAPIRRAPEVNALLLDIVHANRRQSAGAHATAGESGAIRGSV